jgi:FtsH-binding integral membrane protein
MCWNAEVSIQSFAIGLLAIFFLIMTGTSAPTIFFYTTIVFMQLIEYIVWTYGSDPEINFYASLGGAGLLMLQPIASVLTIGSGSTRLMMLISYVVLGVITHFIDQDGRSLRERYRMETGPDTPSDDNAGVHEVKGRLRLHWKWLDPIPWSSLAIYFIFLIGPLLIMKQFDLTALVFLTLGFSIYSFGKGWGSMWCWIVNGMVVIGALKSAL